MFYLPFKLVLRWDAFFLEWRRLRACIIVLSVTVLYMALAESSLSWIDKVTAYVAEILMLDGNKWWQQIRLPSVSTSTLCSIN
jgi:hypothetical protein